MKIGEPRRAIEDLNKALELDQEPVAFCSRGEVYRHLGEYEKALEDFHRGEAIDPAEWKDAAFGLLYQADCHARLGHEAEALACCARLPTTSGLRASPALRPATRPRLRIHCAVLRPMPDTKDDDRSERRPPTNPAAIRSPFRPMARLRS
jgi:hypothetical protein